MVPRLLYQRGCRYGMFLVLDSRKESKEISNRLKAR